MEQNRFHIVHYTFQQSSLNLTKNPLKKKKNKKKNMWNAEPTSKSFLGQPYPSWFKKSNVQEHKHLTVQPWQKKTSSFWEKFQGHHNKKWRSGVVRFSVLIYGRNLFISRKKTFFPTFRSVHYHDQKMMLSTSISFCCWPRTLYDHFQMTLHISYYSKIGRRRTPRRKTLKLENEQILRTP